MFKPDGYSSLSAYLLVADADALIGFATAAFGARITFTHRRDTGRIGHAELRIDDSILMLGEMPDGPAGHLHLYVADVDATFARALAAGATVAQAIAEKGDGDRRGGVTDPSGTTWWISTQITPRAG